VLPSLWEAVAGTIEVTWSIRDEETGKFSSFTPEMDKVWRWKDELPERGLACVGKHLGGWVCLVAPRLLGALYARCGRQGAAEDFRDDDALTPLQRELAEAVLEAGPSTGPELRRLVGCDKKEAEPAIRRLQRALVLTHSGLVRRDQGWGAVAVDLLARRWGEHLRALPAPDEARRTLAATLLTAAGEVSAADAAGALGIRQREARATLDELVELGAAVRREDSGFPLWCPGVGGSSIAD
jgi:hypothetical protein